MKPERIIIAAPYPKTGFWVVVAAHAARCVSKLPIEICTTWAGVSDYLPSDATAKVIPVTSGPVRFLQKASTELGDSIAAVLTPSVLLRADPAEWFVSHPASFLTLGYLEGGGNLYSHDAAVGQPAEVFGALLTRHEGSKNRLVGLDHPNLFNQTLLRSSEIGRTVGDVAPLRLSLAHPGCSGYGTTQCTDLWASRWYGSGFDRKNVGRLVSIAIAKGLTPAQRKLFAADHGKFGQTYALT